MRARFSEDPAQEFALRVTLLGLLFASLALYGVNWWVAS